MVSDSNSDLFISDDPKVFEKELEDRDYYTQDNVFWVPQKARWEKLRAQAKQPDIGSIIDKAMVDIENENKFLQGKYLFFPFIFNNKPTASLGDSSFACNSALSFQVIPQMYR